MLEPLQVDGLGRHLEDRYGVEVVEITPLDAGVFRSIVVTDFLEDHGPLTPGRPAGILGALLGRLHAHPATNVRPGGAWHHLSFEGGPREEMFVPANAISTADGKLAIVDWTGAGRWIG